MSTGGPLFAVLDKTLKPKRKSRQKASKAEAAAKHDKRVGCGMWDADAPPLSSDNHQLSVQ